MTPERELRLVDAVVRLINHKLRTPLSVVTNELFCLQAEEPREEIERAQKKIAEISQLLQEASSLPTSAVTLEKLSLKSMHPDFDALCSLNVHADRELFRSTLRRMGDLIGPYSDGEIRWSAQLKGSECVLTLSARAQAYVQRGEWHLASDFSREQGAADSFLPLEIDCAMTAQSARLTLVVDEHDLSVRLFFGAAE